jgi:hypothetical protein
VARVLRCGVIAAALLLASCGEDEEPTVLEPPVETERPDAAAGQPLANSCVLLPADRVATAVGAPGRLSPEPQPSDPTRGAVCNYVEAGNRRILFVVQVQQAPDGARARQLVERTGGDSVDGLGDAARYEQTGLVASQLAFAKGARAVFFTSQSQSVGQQAMVDLARQALPRV